MDTQTGEGRPGQWPTGPRKEVYRGISSPLRGAESKDPTWGWRSEWGALHGIKGCAYISSPRKESSGALSPGMAARKQLSAPNEWRKQTDTDVTRIWTFLLLTTSRFFWGTMCSWGKNSELPLSCCLWTICLRVSWNWKPEKGDCFLWTKERKYNPLPREQTNFANKAHTEIRGLRRKPES